MINSQRIIILIIAFNVMMGLVTTLDNTDFTGGAYDQDVKNYITTLDQKQREMSSEDAMQERASDDTITGSTIGNPFRWGKIISSLFINAINPWSIHRTDNNTDLENMIARFIMFLRSLLIGLFCFEVYLIFINKKGS